MRPVLPGEEQGNDDEITFTTNRTTCVSNFGEFAQYIFDKFIKVWHIWIVFSIYVDTDQSAVLHQVLALSASAKHTAYRRLWQHALYVFPFISIPA